MKSNTSNYERPDTRRFTPGEWEKRAVTVEWVNCDPVARSAVEGAYYRIDWPMTDSHGYPAS